MFWVSAKFWGMGLVVQTKGGAATSSIPHIHHLAACIPCGSSVAPSISCCQPQGQH